MLYYFVLYCSACHHHHLHGSPSLSLSLSLFLFPAFVFLSYLSLARSPPPPLPSPAYSVMLSQSTDSWVLSVPAVLVKSQKLWPHNLHYTQLPVTISYWLHRIICKTTVPWLDLSCLWSVTHTWAHDTSYFSWHYLPAIGSCKSLRYTPWTLKGVQTHFWFVPSSMYCTSLVIHLTCIIWLQRYGHEIMPK